MYRSSRASVLARIERLEAELESAEAELAARAEELAPLALQLFPLFSSFSDTIEPLRRDGERPGRVAVGVVASCLAVMSVPVLPLALLWRHRRRDVRALAAARRRVKRLGLQIAEARQMLDGSS